MMKRQNNVSSDIEEIEALSDKENELQDSGRPFMNEEEYSDSDVSISYCIPKKRRHSTNDPRLVQETNRYAIDCGKDSFYVDVYEMKQFFGINIIMTYIKYPNYRLYWLSDSGLRLSLIADTISLKRFEEIKRYPHYKNNHTIPDGCDDIFIKVRPLLDMLSHTFQNAANLTEFQATDEMIIPFKGVHRKSKLALGELTCPHAPCNIRSSRNPRISSIISIIVDNCYNYYC
uniref:DDE_Tnp_1_7 domain-containing protein n=1 Tax=Strongyloides papillosus TaxID=174720 RepID=A0A0N5CIM3_STREA